MVVIEQVPSGDRAAGELLDEWKPGTAADKSPDRYTYLVASIAGEPVGVLEGYHDFGGWSELKDFHHLDDNLGSYVSSLYVKPSHRMHGVGGALLDRFIDDARAHGSLAVVAWPDETDPGGLKARLALNRSRGLDFTPPLEDFREAWLMVLKLR